MTELSAAELGFSPLYLSLHLLSRGRSANGPAGCRRVRLDAAEVHSARHVAALLSLYICALIGSS